MTNLRTQTPFLSTPLRDPSSVSGPPSTTPSPLPRSADLATPRKRADENPGGTSRHILGTQRRYEYTVLRTSEYQTRINSKTSEPHFEHKVQCAANRSAPEQKREQKGRIKLSAPDQLRQCEVMRAGTPSHHPGPAEMSALTTAKQDKPMSAIVLTKDSGP